MTNAPAGIPKEILAQREAEAWRLRQQFYTHQRIADEMGLERSTVTKILNRVTKRTVKAMSEDVAERTTAQLAQLEYIADEALQAWHRSKETQRNVSKRTTEQTSGRLSGRGAKTEEMLVQTSDNDGDPRYLDTAIKALGDVRKLLGINAPTRTEVSGPGGAAIPVEGRGSTNGSVDHLTAVLSVLAAAGAVELPHLTAADDAEDDGVHPA